MHPSTWPTGTSTTNTVLPLCSAAYHHWTTSRVSNLLPAAKFLPDKLTDIGGIVEGSQESLQLEQLPIGRIIEPALNGNAVIDLISKGMRAVVNEDHLLHVSLTDIQILEVVALHRQAGLAEHPMLDVLSLRIDAIQKLVGIDLLTGREDDDLEFSVDSLKEFLQIRTLPNVDAVLNAVEYDRKDHVGIGNRLDGTVDQSLVEVQHQCDGRIGLVLGREADLVLRVRHHQMIRGQALDEQVGIELLLIIIIVILLALVIDLDVGTLLRINLLGTILCGNLDIRVDVGYGGIKRVLLNDGIVAVGRVAIVCRSCSGRRLLVHMKVVGLRSIDVLHVHVTISIDALLGSGISVLIVGIVGIVLISGRYCIIQMDQTLHRGGLGVQIGTDPTNGTVDSGLLLLDGHIRGMLISTFYSITILLLGTAQKVHDGRKYVGDLPLTVGAHFPLLTATILHIIIMMMMMMVVVVNVGAV
mmetsp:Transcript_13554/g.38794  ORF Transcript_13554/g.38794 Transcript_13554/m.38794 type:complete len:471 (-) Transcript_13554:1203-2615(-)